MFDSSSENSQSLLNNMSSNIQSILVQFTNQAVPFAQVDAHSDQEAMRLLLEMSGVTSASKVLDVACGPGIVACAFAEIADQVTGIDVTPAMIEQAHQLQKEKGLLNLDWRTGDVTQLPFSDHSFDIVLSRYAFHHFSAPEAVFIEMVRVCKPNGVVLVADVAPPVDKIEKYNQAEKLRDDSHVSALAPEIFLELAKRHHLTDILTSSYRLEIKFQTLLEAAFQKPGDQEKLVSLIKDDLGKDDIGLGAHLKGQEIYYAFPILVMKGNKAE